MPDLIILPCSCKHDYQDSRYGAGKRYHNMTMKGTKDNPMVRCTVCATTRPLHGK